MGKNLDRLKQAYALGMPGMAQTLGAMGRGNDSLVAHITPEEAMMLKAMGGSGTINPRTGLLEFDDGGDGNGSDGGGDGNSGGGDSDSGGEGNNDGWGGGDWGGNVDFGGWEGWGAPSAPSTPGLGFAGDDPNSGMANIFGNSAPGLGFAGDNADYGMANIIGDSTANITSNADGGNDGYNNAPGNYDGNTYVPPVFTEPPTTTAPPATTTPSTGGTTPSTGGTTTGGTTTTPATPGTFQFAAPVSPAFYGFELNRLMRQYGVPAPTIMPYGGAAASTAQTDAAKAAYDQNVYQNYVNEYQNRLANTNMYNMAQFTPNPANFRPQYAAPIANPTYAPANYGGIADVYSKYFGRQPEQAGVEYWGKTGLTGDALQKAITSGAQNMDLEYLRKNYPNMGYARGGRVGYAEGGETETPATEGERPERSTSEPMTPDQARRYRELMTRYLPSTNYGPQLATAQQAARSEAEAFSNMIRQMSERTESPTSRAEMYFRLASAFGAPTRTGQFTENLALAGREMGEYAKGRRADEAERRALGLRAQELRMAGARQDLASLQALAGQESAERRAILPRIIEAEVRANTPNARQSRIADLMRIHGFDEPTASGIVDGIIQVIPGGPGEPPVLVNKATEEIRPLRMGAAPVVGTQPAGQSAEQPPAEQPAAMPSAPAAGEIPAVNLRRQQAAPTVPAMPSGATVPAAPTTVDDFYAARRQRGVEQAGQTAEAETRGRTVVQREDQPGRVEEAGQTAEAQARGRSTVEAETEERKRRRGQEMIESVLRDMMRTYGRLDELGGIPSESRTTLQNVPAYLAGTGAGQEVGRALATQTQTQRNQIQASVRQLLTAIKNATGMSAQEMNSNVELQSLLDAVSNPRQSIESVRGILASISRQYGLGELTVPEPTAPPTPAPREQGQGSRRRGAATNVTPTLEQFLAAARRANPNVSDEALTDYYNRTYGGR